MSELSCYVLPMKALSLLILSFFIFSWSSQAQQEELRFSYKGKFDRINVYIAERQGGLGDIVSSIMMIDRLREDFPLSQIRAIFSRGEAQVISSLFPNFQADASFQQFRGVSFYSDNFEQIPLADLDLSFSNGQRKRVTAPLYLSFSEYSGYASSQKWQHKFQLRGIDVFSDSNFRQSAALRLYAGVGNIGAYIGYQAPERKASKSELVKNLAPYIESSGLKDMDKALWGFAYASSSSIRKSYLEFINELYAEAYFGDEKIYIVMNELSELPQDLHPKIKLLEYKKLPFDLSKEVLANSDIPILVTGDASLTLALEYQKLFLYEEQSWKRFSIDNLIHTVSSNKDTLDKDFLSLLWKNAPEKKINISKLVDRFKNNPKIADNFSSAVGKLRSDYGLSQNLFLFLELLSQVELDSSFGQNYKDIFEALYSAWSINQSFEKINIKLVDLIHSEVENKQKMKYLKTLLSLQVDPAQDLSRKHWRILADFMISFSSHSKKTLSNSLHSELFQLLEREKTRLFLFEVIKRAKRKQRSSILSYLETFKNVGRNIEQSCAQKLLSLF